MNAYHLIVADGDGKQVTRLAHNEPACARIYHHRNGNPANQMGGREMSPSVILFVNTKGEWSVDVKDGRGNTETVAEGKFEVPPG